VSDCVANLLSEDDQQMVYDGIYIDSLTGVDIPLNDPIPQSMSDDLGNLRL
jgi:hypothetical protein